MALDAKNVSKRLVQLAARLVNITRANKSIRLLRKTKKQCFDAAEVDSLRGGVSADLVRRVIQHKASVVLSHRDCPIDPRNERYQLLMDGDDNLEEIETPEYALVRQFRKLDSNLTQLSRNANLIEAETGASELYLGYPWITGTCDDTEGTFLQAPLMLFPVSITAQRDPRLQWTVQPREDAEPLFNEALVLALEQYHETKLSPEFVEEAEQAAESETAAENPGMLIQWFHERLSALGLRMTEPVPELKRLAEYKSTDIPDSTPGFTIRSHAVVGYFPQADSAIRHDLESLIPLNEQGQLGDILARMMDSSAAAPPAEGGSKLSMDDVPEQDTCWIMDSDASQETAMLHSRTEPCLVVHGPPGTGKSQVICNLISDALAKGERVLVCCQKRAALDVVYQRLESAGLGRNVALIHDHSNDRQSLYERIGKALDTEVLDGATAADQVRALADSIDATSKTLREIANELHRPRRCGYSARQLYSMALNVRDNTDSDVSRVATLFHREQLDKFLDRLRRQQDMHGRLSEHASAWAGRKSFARLSFADRSAIERALDRTTEIGQALLEMQHSFGSDLPSASEATLRLKALDEIIACAGSPLEDVSLGSALLDATSAGKSKATIEAVGRLLPILRQLPPRPATQLEDVGLEMAQTLETYNQKRRSIFRVFSSAYRDAKRKTATFLAVQQLADTSAVVAEQAQLIRAHHAWTKMDKCIEGTPLASRFATAANAEELDRQLVIARQASDAATKVRTVAASLGQLQIRVLKPGNTLPEVAEQAGRLAVMGKCFDALKTKVMALQPYVKESVCAFLLEKADKGAGELLAVLAQMKQGLTDFDSLQALDDIEAELSEIEAKVYRHVRKLGNQANWTVHVREALLIGWLSEIEQESRALRKVSTGEVGDIRQQFRANLQRRRELNRKRLALQLHGRATEIRFEPGRQVDGRHRADTVWRDLKHQVTKKRRLWPLRKLVHDLRWPLLEVMPCWLVSPETLSASFPLEPGLFDLAIFDEASQLAVQFGVPALYRAKRVVIAGDEQQLRPFDLFGALGMQADGDMDETEEDSDAASVEAESILSLSRARFPEEMLSCHYRSRFEELIEFSNQGFYDGRLLTVPSADSIGTQPIEWRKVHGLWEKRRNQPEAAAVLELLFELLKAHGPKKSIGVITFNNTQQAEIEDQLDKRSETDPEFSALVSKARNPESGNRDEALFVKNIENVQGDERDIIVFSIGYAADSAGRVYSRFGSLSLEGGDNRLNVAISRAKERVIVVSSIEPEELSVSTSTHRGPRLLRDYLAYAKAVSCGNVETRDAVLRSIRKAVDVSEKKAGSFDSELEEQVYEELKRRNFTVRPQVGVSGYRIDLGVVDPNDPSRYVLGIECDGATYHSAHSVRERDAYRQRFLELRGWKIHRIWSRNWWRNKADEIQKLLAILGSKKA